MQGQDLRLFQLQCAPPGWRSQRFSKLFPPNSLRSLVYLQVKQEPLTASPSTISLANHWDSSTTCRQSNATPIINWPKSVSREYKTIVAYRASRHQIEYCYFRLREPLPAVNFIEGLPVLPGVVGSLPGAGACLPRGSPLVRDKSPSFFQNILRNIPGAHDYLASLLPAPKVELEGLLGKYYWFNDKHRQVILPLSVFKKNLELTTRMEGRRPLLVTVSFTTIELMCICRMIHVHVNQIVLVGPREGGSGQYEYLILSNWARFPIIGLVRNIRSFYKEHKDALENELEKEGFINDYTGSSSIHYADWSKCKPATPISYIRNVLSELFG
uniref:Tyrosine-protein phosphatase domain-containing protein n=1 Tax=Heterorhabditis bacteriophora TaxID=37862 RepID=A0A1I7X532_HETBA